MIFIGFFTSHVTSPQNTDVTTSFVVFFLQRGAISTKNVECKASRATMAGISVYIHEYGSIQIST